MIKIFGATDTDFSSNGDIVIRPTKAKVHREDNGDYYLDLECGLEFLDYIVEGNIAVAPVSITYESQQPTQAFRIHNVTTTGNKISAKCRHVFWDAKNYFIEWSDGYAIPGENLATVLQDYGRVAIPTQNIFVPVSDIEITAPRQYRVERKSLFDAVAYLRDKVGAHMYYNNWAYGLFESIGEDRGVTIRYGSNLKEITRSENWDDVITKLLPTGKDGTLLNAVTPSEDIYITTAYYNTYDIKYIKTLAFDQSSIKRENYQSEAAYKSALVADLRQQANDYITNNQVYLPKISYDLKSVTDFPVDIGDTIRVIDERLGLDLTTHVISFDYDCLTERFENVQFGNFTNNAKGMGNTVKSLAANANAAVIGGKQLQFNTDNTVSWANWG